MGTEARRRVPPEFVVQNPSHANPPSLFLPIMTLAQQLQAAGGAASDPSSTEHDLRLFLTRAWPRLTAWYRWFNSTQQGPVRGSYR